MITLPHGECPVRPRHADVQVENASPAEINPYRSFGIGCYTSESGKIWGTRRAEISTSAMRTIIALAAFIALLSACAADKPDRYQLWASEPTPHYWSAESLWAFAAIEADGLIERSLTLRFTDITADTCSSGEWKRIEVVDQSPPRSTNFLGEAAYALNGRALLINLTANICDSYTEYRGELTDNGFVGVQRVGHLLGGEEIGPVYGVQRNRGTK